MLGKRAGTDMYDQRIHRHWSSVFLEVCCDKTIFFIVGVVFFMMMVKYWKRGPEKLWDLCPQRCSRFDQSWP